MTLIQLCWEFFKTGLFAVGGGLATLPFLTRMGEVHPGWFSTEMLANMVAISESTPGPIGVNMATYVGYTVAGIPGAILATLSLVFPSLVVILLVARVLAAYKSNKYVLRAFDGLRPAVTGLIAAACFSVLKMAVLHAGAESFLASIDWISVALLAVLFALTQWKKLKKVHPAAYIGVGALLGILFRL